jgi:putative DNA methylase
MTRMIERWFPGPEVSANSRSGWGSGNTEVGLMTWFAKRPTAQARAAVLCSLLPWPDDSAEQARLQQLVHDAMTDRFVHSTEVRAEIERQLGDRPAAMLDPFSGRGMIPLEAARLGLPACALDYSWVAVLASRLLTDYANRDWSGEPPLPLEDQSEALAGTRPRLVGDATAFIGEVGRRHADAMSEFYPVVDGRLPWGYNWAITIPCNECGRTFPLVGSLELRKASSRKNRSGQTVIDQGQSFAIEADLATGQWQVRVHDGAPVGTPTRQIPPGKSRYDSGGKLAVCPFCGFGHDRPAQMELLATGRSADAILLAADIDSDVGKRYRPVEDEELRAAQAAEAALAQEAPFTPLLPARPREAIPAGNTWTVQATVYGAKTYGDLMNARQSLSFVRLARVIGDLGEEIRAAGASDDYVRALTGYAAAAMARKLRRATRGCTLDQARNGVHDIFATESSLNFSFDYFEVGLGGGPGSWESVAGGTLRSLEAIVPPAGTACAVEVSLGTATSLPFADGSLAAVVTDPPYDAMIDYSDASDLFYVWLKRALVRSWPELAITAHPNGVQEKDLEIIVKKGGTSNNDHRDRRHYDTKIAEAFSEMRRVVAADGVVTIVFGHGEPEVWQRLLAAIDAAGLVLTGAWPAKTEAGGKVGFSNIVSTLTMACRPAPVDRPLGRKGSVESEIREEIRRRYPDWERWGLAPADMLMAAAGPAMEVVGRYGEVRDSRGERVDIHTFLPLARAAVQEVMAVEIDHRPLEAFDARTRFALWWVRLYEREPQPKSELRWQALASSLDMDRVKDLVPGGKSAALVTSDRFEVRITHDSAVIDVALALAAASEQGLAAMGEVLASSSLDSDDQLLWAAIQFLADRLPGSDPDAIAFHRVLRARAGIGSAAENVVEAARAKQAQQDTEDRQIKLL